MRVKNGTVRAGDRIRMMSTGSEFDVVEVGVFTPDYTPADALMAGDVGYIAASIKNVSQTRVGDTVTLCRESGKGTASGL